jgi:hypothetical protein
MSNPNFPAANPTPTQAELNTTQAQVYSNSATRPTYAADGSGGYRALPAYPHPNGHPPGSIYR